MQLKVGTTFYWPPAGQRVIVCEVRRLQYSLIADKPLAQFLRERSDWYPRADDPVLNKQHDEFEAGAIITETMEMIEVQGVDWVTGFKPIYLKWTIRKEAEINESGDEGSGGQAAGLEAKSLEPQHDSEPRAGDKRPGANGQTMDRHGRG